jgi:membrane-associated phospholipid phosphatase
LMPHFPVDAPRFAFAGEDLPAVDTVFRRMNLWILNHWDIRSSVFPSGHVAAAFSAALAMRLAAPARRRLAGALLTIAVLVWMNTVYGRYHYAADGLAGLAVSVTAIGVLAATWPRRGKG